MDCFSDVLAFTKNPMVNHNLTSLKHVGSGAAPLRKEFDGWMHPCSVVVYGYGITETCEIVSSVRINM